MSADEVDPDAHFTDLGGDSLSALTFSNLLQDIFGVEVPVGVIISPAAGLRPRRLHRNRERESGPSAPPSPPCTAATPGDPGSDLTLDKFIDAATLAAAKKLPRTSHSGTARSGDPQPFC